MDLLLNEIQMRNKERFKEFSDTEIIPYASKIDAEESTPRELIAKLKEIGCFGATVPQEYGGTPLDALSFGLMCQEIGRGSSSLLSLITVHGMVCQAILKWGTDAQRRTWLPRLADGSVLGAFALTEPSIGTDAKNVATKIVEENGHFVVSGRKKWISYAQMADLFLVFGQTTEGNTGVLVERGTPGLEIQPMSGLMGFRAAMLGEVILEKCIIPQDNLIGRNGYGFSHVGSTALDHGRFCIAWGSVGLSLGCLEASLEYSNTRKQGDGLIRNYQLIQAMIADMLVEIKAAQMLCYHAACLRNNSEPESITETSIAKYFSSQVATKASANAVQIHGANGISDQFPVQRYFRDARIMEIIEGSSQIQQVIIAKTGFQQYLRSR